ncbi:hypothetical protein FGADI_5258 [Fusarium gaditjirri]|uniref:C2H2-type domain-containing protein n=1 Tax=Fusarium gaditjirri TaxID=282569 RepID=A0A8H4TAW9_9HYPO|nr:hypothetical protein FGADI_5258 [Fusarium gaditjirri]
MNAGQVDGSNLKVFVGRSNETSHGDRATAKDAIPAPYVSNTQSKGRESQQMYDLSGTANEGKGARDYHEEVLGPQKDACQARYQEQHSKEGYQKSPPISGHKITEKPSNSKRKADDSREPHKRIRTSMTADTNKRLETYACPYYRKDPERHLDCINLKMLRISDVKQHLKRRHTFNHSCTRCFKGFSSSTEYEEHVLQQACPIVECNNNDSLSPTAQEALKDRVDRSSSSEHQWHQMSKILFGELGLSLNPYQDGVFKEITGIIRGIWKNEGQNIISSLSETQNVPCADQLRPLLSEILTRVEDCFEQKEQKPSKESPREGSESNQGASIIKNDCGPLGINEPHNLPMQDWYFSTGLHTSDNPFSYTMLPEYQNQQVGCPFMNLSAGLRYPDDGRNWQFMGPNSTTAMENIMAHQVSMGEFSFTEDDLVSTQMPNMFN